FAVDECSDGGHDIQNVTETSALRAIAVHGHRRAGASLIDESRDHHSVVRYLSRPNGVKQSTNDTGQSMRFVIGKQEKLVDCFGDGVVPAALRRGTVHDVV